MKEKYDVVIVGAGPAGLRCAEILAKGGKDVLVLEKNSEIIRKICTGFWGITEKTRGMNLPEKLFEKKFKEAIISTPYRKIKVRLEKPFAATIDRKKLSEWMHKEAKKSGAEIRFGSQVTKIGKNYVLVDKKKKYFDYLVGADGSSSIVRSSLGLKNKIGIGIQYWVKNKFRFPEIHLDADRFALGYAWIAPYKNKTCVGAGADVKLIPTPKIKESLDLWCKEKGISIKNALYEGAPINSDYKGYKFGNRFLIGDAGGFASGLTGEGIFFAMSSGEDVAKLILDKNHKPELIDFILRLKREHELIADALKINKTLEKAEYNVLLSLLKIKLFDEGAVELVC